MLMKIFMFHIVDALHDGTQRTLQSTKNFFLLWKQMMVDLSSFLERRDFVCITFFQAKYKELLGYSTFENFGENEEKSYKVFWMIIMNFLSLYRFLHHIIDLEYLDFMTYFIAIFYAYTLSRLIVPIAVYIS